MLPLCKETSIIYTGALITSFIFYNTFIMKNIFEKNNIYMIFLYLVQLLITYFIIMLGKDMNIIEYYHDFLSRGGTTLYQHSFMDITRFSLWIAENVTGLKYITE